MADLIFKGKRLTNKNGLHLTYVVTPPKTYADWFLPSRDELDEMYDELKLYGYGDFGDDFYWCSSENVFADSAFAQRFSDGYQYFYNKVSISYNVRACRSFYSTDTYGLRDTGPAGGLIFYIDGNNYFEAAPSDQSASYIWSNINTILIGTTGTAIGTGQANTTAIIGQAGHTNSAAKLCNDLIITL